MCLSLLVYNLNLSAEAGKLPLLSSVCLSTVCPVSVQCPAAETLPTMAVTTCVAVVVVIVSVVDWGGAAVRRHSATPERRWSTDGCRSSKPPLMADVDVFFGEAETLSLWQGGGGA